MSALSTCSGLLVGYLADQCLGDPVRWHPVAGFGRVAQGIEQVTWADSRTAGVRQVAVLVGATSGLGWLLERAVQDRPLAHAGLVAIASWAVLGGRSLVGEASTMGQLLTVPDRAAASLSTRGLPPTEPERRELVPGELGPIRDTSATPDLAPARARLSHLCSRDASDLSHADLVRATLESLAENTSDAVTAPLWWGAIAGVPGLLGYRAANTLDAMIGYRSARYQRFGWAAARFDDVLNLAPARLCALLTVLAAPAVGGQPAHALADLAARRAAAPEPERGPSRGQRGGRARGPVRWEQPVRRHGRGPRRARRWQPATAR